ncbi:glycine zipper domain-containing protein, partial [Paramuribaculum intestinale]|uniref:glycine zipper domain-containing protein n=1 Tax=Paramuribaculum intestinale TaxID=2094151 RepID=UPI003EB920AC
MKKTLKIMGASVMALCLLISAGCSSMTNTGKGALIGGGKGAGIGSAIGAAVGAGAGALIGKKMDKQQAQLE